MNLRLFFLPACHFSDPNHSWMLTVVFEWFDIIFNFEHFWGRTVYWATCLKAPQRRGGACFWHVGGYSKMHIQECYSGLDLLSLCPWWWLDERRVEEGELGGCLLWWSTLWVSSVISGLTNELYEGSQQHSIFPAKRDRQGDPTPIKQIKNCDLNTWHSIFLFIFFSSVGSMTLGMAVSQSIPRFGTDRNISTTFGWIDMEFCICVDGAQRMNPECWHLLWLQQVSFN